MALGHPADHDDLSTIPTAGRDTGGAARRAGRKEPLTGPCTGPRSVPDGEVDRIAAVRRYDVLDTPPGGSFDRVAAMAARSLDAPMASVAIVEADRIRFTAAHGLDGVTEVGRGPGLCASAIGQDELLLIPDTLEDPVARDNPLVTGPTRVRFYAAAPITTADGHRLGTVNVMDTRPRLITLDDTETLYDLAAMIMDQMELRLSSLHRVGRERELRAQAERDKADLEEFAGTLQRTLLPPVLPRIPGLELASHYQTASARQVGGDFYDVFALDSGRWAFFLGDVCGKGPAAAAVTSLVRYTLRAAALADPDPVAVLEHLNTAMLLDPEHGGRFCTAVFGTITPISGGFTVRVGTGGHPTVMRTRSTGGTPARRGRTEGVVRGAEPLRIGGGMLVGALEEATFAATDLRLGPGDGLLLYTDGLVEGTTPDGEMPGEQGLIRHLAEYPAGVDGPDGAGGPRSSAPEIVRVTAALLDTFTGNHDDVAILAMTASPDPANVSGFGGPGPRPSRAEEEGEP
ncbi:PP2C family protein-serine/threonine phosphatase [Actinomadura algeriensis]|uniref:Sigma-B regulation protein RsbU (Phosphoserine phosphatase) n=1 Tax=Actinomadura algeriensis TaxID=1679523 RepID=A0ABR9JXM2_9ACTN|nr:GAF domain-containing SpoIIE family protein phosphatase [Actinomadura algeriensis]MBE1535228.1 sigma-B regulation protein RsbU (phosphoserine phosphatase) [Actinomadura algeriensis]